MRLEDVAAVLRPRAGWEAVDLGVAMMRRFWRPVIASWLFSVVPVCLVVFLVLNEHLFVSLLVVWWLKPLFDRIPRFVFSRALFGAPPSLGETLRAVPRLWRRDFLHGLFALRFQSSRAFSAPVGDLEGLRGPARRQRVRGLASRVAVASNAAMVGWLFEIGLTVALASFVVSLLPAHLHPPLQTPPNIPAWLEQAWATWLVRIAYLIAFTVSGPLHVAGGFALYLNRRTELEGWDIELAFRRCAKRIRALAGSRLARAGTLVPLIAVALVGLAGLAGAPAATAAEPDPKRVVQEVLGDETFGRSETREEWRWRSDDDAESDFDLSPLGSIAGTLIEIGAWMAIVGLGAFLVYQLIRGMGWIATATPASPGPRAPPPEVLGLDLRPETLPDDVPAAVLAHWRAGEVEAAAGLLYRASIAALIERDDLQIEPSDTEVDCLRRARDLPDVRRTEAFAAVTRVWQRCAYSPSIPADAEIERLCADWPAAFGASS